MMGGFECGGGRTLGDMQLSGDLKLVIAGTDIYTSWHLFLHVLELLYILPIV